MNVTLVTPAHSRDVERFLMQRESIVRCRIALPHVVVVNEEEVGYFRALPLMDGARIVSTNEIFPVAVEARRRSYHLRRRNLAWWKNRVYGKPIHGWGIQQIIKLAAPSYVDTEGIVCLDADTFFVRPVTSDNFYAVDKRLHLYETCDDTDVEMTEWIAHSLRFLGLKPTGHPIVRYTHSPTVLHRQIVLEMQKFISERHEGHWMTAVLDADMVMEYSTYGIFASAIDSYRRVIPVRPPLTCAFWWKSDVEHLREQWNSRVCNSELQIVAVQSNTGFPVDELRLLAEPLWNQIENSSA